MIGDEVLNPCPVCNGDAVIFRYETRGAINVQCTDCSEQTDDYKTEEEALHEWITFKLHCEVNKFVTYYNKHNPDKIIHNSWIVRFVNDTP